MSDFRIENGELVEYTGKGGDVVIPDSVTSIGYRAFYDYHRLTSISIPDSVTSIEKEAISNCSSPTSKAFRTASRPSGKRRSVAAAD